MGCGKSTEKNTRSNDPRQSETTNELPQGSQELATESDRDANQPDHISFDNRDEDEEAVVESKGK